MDKTLQQEYTQILRDELVPALGCTEPIAIALAAATATRMLGCMPRQITVECSGNVIKNAMGVVVPTTGDLKGIDVSAILGAVAGDADKGLEVLAQVTPEDVALTRQLLAEGLCKTQPLQTSHALHILVTVAAGDQQASAEIRDKHTQIVRKVHNGKLVYENVPTGPTAPKNDMSRLNLADIYDFATQAPLEELAPLLQQQIDCNTRIAQEGLAKPYGAQVGQTLLDSYDRDNIRVYAKALAAAGSDARMGGCPLPVMINSGSGNQGMTVSLPVIAYARHLQAEQEQLLRALVLSNLVALLQKREIGRLSAFCGVVCAACGSGAAITYLHKGDLAAINRTIINLLANVSGMVCDGAKSSCAIKIASAVDAAILAHEMSLRGLCFAPGEGIVKTDAQATMQSVGQMASQGMQETDREILRIMLEPPC